MTTEPGHRHSHGHPHPNQDAGRARWRRALAELRPHSHDHTEAVRTAEESSREGVRAAWISLAGMGATALLQVVIVAVSGSIALLADTVHNLGHLVTTIPLVLAFRLGRRAPTRRYTYGFRRAEDLVGLLVAAVIALSAALIIWESVRAIAEPRDLTNLGWVLAAGIAGAAGNEIVALYRIRVGRRIGSAALVAEGQHARVDGLTSVAVVLGVVGVWLGVPQADPVVGLVIAGVVLWLLVSSARTVVRRLMDGVDEATVDAVEATAASVAGVDAVDRVRARWSGHRLEAEVDIAVPADLTVREAHDVAERVHHDLLHAVRHLDHVAVHVNPSGVDGAHVLTGHHASPEARRRYLSGRAQGRVG